MENYESLIAECLAAMDKPLPKACLKTSECRMAGGCPVCYSGLLAENRRRKFEIRTIEEYRNRHGNHRVFGIPLPSIH
jgi:hypothetical protein